MANFPIARRTFFDEFAANNDFDPLIPENWYEIEADTFLREKVSKKRGFRF